MSSKFGLGYSSANPLCLKIHKETSQHITFEEIEEENEQEAPNERTLVFNHLGNPGNHVSVFDRIGNQRPEDVQVPRTSVHARIGALVSKKKKFKVKKEHIIEIDSKDIHSKFPSRMKRYTKWMVSNGQELKGRQQTIVITGQEPCLIDEVDEEMNVAVNHITMEELDQDDEVLIEEGIEDAPPTFEEGNKVAADDLKEVNLGTPEDIRPTFLSANLTTEEMQDYVKLLSEYRDIFAWTYT